MSQSRKCAIVSEKKHLKYSMPFLNTLTCKPHAISYVNAWDYCQQAVSHVDNPMLFQFDELSPHLQKWFGFFEQELTELIL